MRGLALAGVDTFKDTITHIDLMTLCNSLPPQSIDMILCDLPYGTTACSWDEVIPFEPMWKAFKRVIKPRGAIVLTGSQPFTARLINSNLAMFRYEWIWDKQTVGGFLDANRKPLKRHENVMVFCRTGAPYNPQMSKGEAYSITRARVPASVYGKHTKPPTINTGFRYPTSIIEFPNIQTRLHPTQKPVALFEYLIRTYTQPGEIVLDPCVGSGTTALAARNTGRHYICGDTSEEYVTIARQRLAAPYTPDMFTALPQPPAPKPEQHALFAPP